MRGSRWLWAALAAVPPVRRRLRPPERSGEAVVVQVADTWTRLRGRAVLRIRVHVRPDDGAPPFEAELAELADAARPVPGQRCQVVYRPPSRPWAARTGEYVPALPGPAAEPGPGAGAPAWGTSFDEELPLPVQVVHALTALDSLRASGALTDEEFAAQKARLLDG